MAGGTSGQWYEVMNVNESWLWVVAKSAGWRKRKAVPVQFRYSFCVRADQISLDNYPGKRYPGKVRWFTVSVPALCSSIDQSIRGNVQKKNSLFVDIVQIEVDPPPSYPIFDKLIFDKVLIMLTSLPPVEFLTKIMKF